MRTGTARTPSAAKTPGTRASWATIAGAIFGISAPLAYADGPQICVQGYVDINGTQQSIDQCAP